MSTFFPVQAQPFILFGSGIAAGSTTLQLTSFLQIDGATKLVMADFGSIGFGTLDPGNGTLEEAITFTGITQNTDGTATLTGVSSQGFITPYTQTSGVQQGHAGGSYFVLSNTAGFYNEFPTLPNSGTIAGVYTFIQYPIIANEAVFPTTENQFATKGYADSLTFAGAPNGSPTQKGVYQSAVATQFAVGIALGSTGASLVPPNSLFSATATTATVGVVTNGSGFIVAGFGGVANSLATLNSSSLVVQNPTNATATPTATKIPIADANATLNTWVPGSMQTFVAGESINASSTPKAVILSPSDGKVYNLNATSATATAFAVIGFVNTPQNVTVSQNIIVQTDGTIRNFSSLSAGAYYYSQNTNGTIGTIAGSQSLVVGQADSTGTNLQVITGKKITSGITTFSSTATSAFVCGFQPTRVTIYGTAGTSGTWGQSSGGYDINGGNHCVLLFVTGTNASSGGNDTSHAWYVNAGTTAANNHSGVVTTITSTGFSLANVVVGSPATLNLYWEAEA